MSSMRMSVGFMETLGNRGLKPEDASIPRAAWDRGTGAERNTGHHSYCFHRRPATMQLRPYVLALCEEPPACRIDGVSLPKSEEGPHVPFASADAFPPYMDMLSRHLPGFARSR